jgi:SM-20-related protein
VNQIRRLAAKGGGSTTDETLYGRIADDIEKRGFSICPTALPQHLSDALLAYQQSLNESGYVPAGVGRGSNYLTNEFVRTDEICWVTGNSDACSQWIDWTNRLQRFLNQKLFVTIQPYNGEKIQIFS